MAGTSPSVLRRDRLLDEAIVTYLEAVECGQAPDEQQWLTRYPEVAAELAECLRDQQKVCRWTEPLRRVARAASMTVDTPFDGRADDMDTSVELPTVPLGDYELLEEIARGGMGVVYKARQLSLGRVVALKMIRTGPWASTADVQRFRAEAEAAASLDHPHIMPIYEVGECQGRPYFSMKLFEGGSLAEHLARFGDDQHATARLMALVARAVHHAHQRGILHRDLKPANILLDAQWRPSVADFGLARPVQGDSGITQSGAIVGTPSYMAPEQAAGQKDLTTAVDVYSLGSVLYAMLTGRPPFHTDTPLETVRLVLEEEPSRPRLLDPRVSRDLETICLKCLNKKPDQRYGSAEALAEDLERWLCGAPIYARRSTAWERLWKNAKRNPAAAALVVVSIVLVLGLAVGLFAFQDHRARLASREQQRVSHAWQEAERYLSKGEAYLANNDLQNARLFFEKALAKSSAEPTLRDLTVRAEWSVGEANRMLHEEEMRRKAREKYDQFFKLRDDVLLHGTLFTGVDLPANLEATRRAGEEAFGALGWGLGGTGASELDPYLSDLEKAAISNGCYELLLILAEASVQQDPPDVERARRLAERSLELGQPTKAYYLRHGRYLQMLGDYAGAEADFRQADLHAPTSSLDHFLLGDDFRRRRDLPAAIREFESAVHLQLDHFWARYCLAICLWQQGKFEAAKAHLSACLSARSDLYAPYLIRGIAHVKLKEFEQAEDDFRAVLDLAADEPYRGDYLRYAVFVNRGVMRQHQHRFEQAVAEFNNAIALDPNQFQAYWNLAKLYEQQGRLDAAVAAQSKAIEVAESRSIGTRAELAMLYDYRARLHLDREEDGAALKDLERALETEPFAESYVNMGRLFYRQKRYGEAVRAYDDALRTAAADPGKFPRAAPFRRRAEALMKIGEFREAARALKRYLDNRGKPDAEVFRLLGFCRAQDGDHSGAIDDYTIALRLQPNDPLTHAYRGWVYYVRNAPELALEDFERAIALDPQSGDAYNGRGYVRIKLGDAVGAVDDAEEALRRGPETPRMAWNAARVYAQAMSLLEAQPATQTGDDPRPRAYRDRAIKLLRKALEQSDADQRAAFWRERIDADAGEGGAFYPLRSSPEFLRLAEDYLPDKPTANGTPAL